MKEENEIGMNKSAYFHYSISKIYECGIVLLGTEVKSLRAKKINFSGSYAAFKHDELFLFGFKIEPYIYSSLQNHESDRIRKILLKKNELKKLKQILQEQKRSLIPLKVYIKNNKIKISIGIAKGKTHSDKRETIKNRTLNREISSALKRGSR